MGIKIRTARGDDSVILHGLASACSPLIVHTPFTYWTMVFSYPDSVFIAEEEGRPVGFLMAIPSQKRGGIFVWQIGIIPTRRQQGLAKRLMRALFEASPDWGRFIVTIDPDNEPSLATFRAIATEYGASLEKWEDAAFASDAAVLKRDSNETILVIVLRRD